ncbi:MAG: hypothetical protein C0504_03650 [Candidatus Solibacter sp.]|nr:hypothetical protein [Candidatus Solibacter sp.]
MPLKSISRRSFAASIPAVAAAQPSQELRFDGELVRRHDGYVDNLIAKQITAPRDPARGSFADDFGIVFAGTPAGIIDASVAAILCRQSRHYGSAALMERVRLAAGWLERNQLKSGNFDLATTNFNSPPDTGFITHSLSSAALHARRGGLKEVSALIEPVLRRMAAAMTVGGVHTPNHRWVVCEALAQMYELFGEPAYLRRIGQWLAETIDIDTDGQYNERSTAIYNAVTNIALVVMADKLKRPELLEPVRRNLDAMLYLLHADGEVVTEISIRQDAFERGDMRRYWMPLYYLAVTDNNPRYANLARAYAGHASLSQTMTYPQLRQPLPASAPLPHDYVRELSEIRAARIRRGPRSATVLWNGVNRFLAFRKGGCVIEGVRFASAFFGKGQFVPSAMRKTAAGYQLSQELEGPYYQPLEPSRPVAVQEYGATRLLRRRSEVCRLTQSATVRETASGFDIDISIEGTDNVPVSIEVLFRQGTQLDGVAPAAAADSFLLSEGHATATSGPDSIRVGPGLGLHRWTQIRGAAPKLPGPSVYLCGFTPLRHTLKIECP